MINPLTHQCKQTGNEEMHLAVPLLHTAGWRARWCSRLDERLAVSDQPDSLFSCDQHQEGWRGFQELLSIRQRIIILVSQWAMAIRSTAVRLRWKKRYKTYFVLLAILKNPTKKKTLKGFKSLDGNSLNVILKSSQQWNQLHKRGD